jgi:hypothetical protein
MNGLGALQVFWSKWHTVEELAFQLLQSWTMNYKVREFVWQCSVLHRPWISTQLDHVDQSIRLRCIVSIWLPSQKVFTFVARLGTISWWQHLGIFNTLVWVIRVTAGLPWLPVSMVTIELGVCWRHTPISVVIAMWQHTIGLCVTPKMVCLASVVTELQWNSAWILRRPMIERVRGWINNNTGYQFQNDWSH